MEDREMKEKVNELRHKTNAEVIISLAEQIKALKEENEGLQSKLAIAECGLEKSKSLFDELILLADNRASLTYSEFESNTHNLSSSGFDIATTTLQRIREV